ncbi:MAG: SMI1/KNR4 family protein [Polyangiaceae bacterium]|nr:SMI1/KNR4 family protein [Polyangiaceae bacterium]
MPRWKQLVTEIRRVGTEILWLEPARDFGLSPRGGAAEHEIRGAEGRLGARLPPSYREFLREHDGWPCFFEGVTLLGTAHLGRGIYDDLARSVFLAAETPVPAREGPPVRMPPGPRALVPFGVDLRTTTIFTFDLDSRKLNGECEVVCWVNDIGIRCADFEGFLETIIELCHAELDALIDRAAACA